ncbi:recombinase RecA [Rosenbergiella sp. S61]|uniref:Recombinase RecA n=1 Tax=Rosenbergiella gaditana TaxID=2726987 RepID=A0ABS5SZC3_9GAMM|nr:recombinase RecA [Rosenbergiella gaditana]MBT0725452.1 recombinase RecA [Rosenbergiella gaditana]
MDNSKFIDADFINLVDRNTPHNWKNYVSEELRKAWHTFTDEQKIMLGKCFEEIAYEEEWE